MKFLFSNAQRFMRSSASKIVLLSLFLILFTQMFAQIEPQALKFDEFEESDESQFYWYYSKETNFSERIERLIKRLKVERKAKVYIIYYHARVTDVNSERRLDNKVDRIKYEIQYQTQIKAEDITEIDGGYRESNMIEFWIAPRNAHAPRSTPTLNKAETFVCPNVNVYSNASFDEPETVNFSVWDYDLKDIENYSLKWTVSGGEIVGGQGLKSIKVNLKNSAVKRVTAFVEIGGLPLPCQKVFSRVGEVAGKILLIDSAERYNYSDLSARMDNLMVEANNNPTARVYIIVYANRNGGSKEMERAVKSVNNIFRFRRYDLSRITIVRGGYREYNTVDAYLLLDDAEPPHPTPTVNKKFIAVPAKPKKLTKRAN